MSQQELEDRLLALEQEIAELKVRVMMTPIGNVWFEEAARTVRDDAEWEESAGLHKAEQMQYEDGN